MMARTPMSTFLPEDFISWLHDMRLGPDSIQCQSDWIHEHSLADERDHALWIMPRRAGATTLGLLACLRTCVTFDDQKAVFVAQDQNIARRAYEHFVGLARANYGDGVQSAIPRWVTFRNGSRCDVMTLEEVLHMPAVQAQQYHAAVFDVPQYWGIDVRKASIVFKNSGAKVISVIGTDIRLEDGYDTVPQGDGEAVVYDMRDADRTLRSGSRGRGRGKQGGDARVPGGLASPEGPKGS